MKRIRERIASLEKRAAFKHVELQRDGFRVVQNDVAVNRIQIIFEARPDSTICSRLKRLGFKWAPSQNAWQRQFTNAAVSAAKQFMAEAALAERKGE